MYAGIDNGGKIVCSEVFKAKHCGQGEDYKFNSPPLKKNESKRI